MLRIAAISHIAQITHQKLSNTVSNLQSNHIKYLGRHVIDQKAKLPFFG